jgi:hypothetical protein
MRLLLDRKPRCKSRINFRIFLDDARNRGPDWATAEFPAQSSQRFGAANGVDFHATIIQIFGESGQTEAERGSSGKKSVTHPLDRAADKIANGFKWRGNVVQLQPQN